MALFEPRTGYAADCSLATISDEATSKFLCITVDVQTKL